MAIVTYPLNNIDYTAADAEIYNSTRTSGVYANTDNLDLTITGARTVSISPGMAWIKNDDFTGKAVAVKAAEELTFDAPDSTLNRIDRVVLGFSATNNATTLYVKKGTSASSPTAPAVTQTPALFELGLFDVAIPAGLTALTAANITDQRANNKVCGIMSDGVTREGDRASVRVDQTVSSWASTMSLANAAITPTSPIELLPGDGITLAQLKALQKAQIVGSTQAAGTLVYKCLGTIPSIAIPLTWIIRRDL